MPGLGLCLPEPIADGWLVRPAGREARVALCLDLSAPAGRRGQTGDRPWRSPLTVRHAEILLLLHLAGAAG